MATPIKIRGIYTTALTKFLMDSGFAIADPSPEIQERFRLAPTLEAPEVLIKDREDHQGVDLVGEADRISRLLRVLQDQLLDATLLQFQPLGEMAKDFLEDLYFSEELVLARLEFGGASKETLDQVRSSVVPTLAHHHRLRIIHPKRLEKAEKELEQRPEIKNELERVLFREVILTPLKKAEGVKLEHLKILGKPIRPREGVLLEAHEQGQRLLIKRSFSQGRYDGLNLPIEEGDYGLTEVQEGSWYVKHSYFSKQGRLKGEYYNINTPVELYPYGARYLDLGIDVVRRAEEKAFIVDREDLALLAREGKISHLLEKKALEVVGGLVEKLK